MTEVTIRQGDSPTAKTVTIGPIDLVFSYTTCVAYRSDNDGWVVSENVWSKTTGKHLNQETPRGVERIPYDEFRAKLEAMLTRIKVA